MLQNEMNKYISDRYSPRAYANTALGDETITSLFEAARWAASARNNQPWRFIYAVREDTVRWNKLFDCLSKSNQKWVAKAPFLMLALVQKTDPNTNKIRSHVGYQLGLAMGNFTLQAMSMGIYLRNMGGYDPERAIANFQIPEIYEPVVMIAAGYPNKNEIIDEDLKVPMGEERKRKPLNELIYDGDWELLR